MAHAISIRDKSTLELSRDEVKLIVDVLKGSPVDPVAHKKLRNFMEEINFALKGKE
jgi:hypothetical protein